MKNRISKLLLFLVVSIGIFLCFSISSFADNSPSTYASGSMWLNTEAIDFSRLNIPNSQDGLSFPGQFKVGNSDTLYSHLKLVGTFNNGSLWMVDFYATTSAGESLLLCSVNPDNGYASYIEPSYQKLSGVLYVPMNFVVQALDPGTYRFKRIPDVEFYVSSSSSFFISGFGTDWFTSISCQYDSNFAVYNLYYGSSLVATTLNNTFPSEYLTFYSPVPILADSLIGQKKLNASVTRITNDDSYLTGYQEGYQNGLNDANDSLYGEGYQDGVSEGYNNGYDTGYAEGVEYGLSINENGELAYQEGYNKGKSDGILEGYQDGIVYGREVGYSEGKSDGITIGYNMGYADGKNASISDSFGDSLLGDTIRMPLEALNSFVIYESPSGSTITLGLVLGGLLGLTVLIAFLKLFAGG